MKIAYADLGDEALLSRFIDEGDRYALGELAKRYERSLLALAGSILSGYGIAPGVAWEESCDLVQETWLQVIRKGASFAGRSRFKTWLYRVVINLCKNRSAAIGRQRVGEARLLKMKEGERKGEDEREGETETPTAWLERLEKQRDLVRALANLASGQREILLLCYHGGMSHTQAAEILEIPVGTLKSRLHAALNELRRILGVDDDETTTAATTMKDEVST